jgi:hypothetical protein
MLATLSSMQMHNMTDNIEFERLRDNEARLEELRGDVSEMASVLGRHNPQNVDEEERQGDSVESAVSEDTTSLPRAFDLLHEPSALGIDESGTVPEPLTHMDGSEPAPVASSRFPTGDGGLIIDFESEDEDEEREKDADGNGWIRLEEDAFREHDIMEQGAENSEAGNERPPAEDVRAEVISSTVDDSADEAQCNGDPEPPFVTDGRGRVVWSSTRPGSGSRKGQNKTGSVALESENEADEREEGGEEGWLARAARQ